MSRNQLAAPVTLLALFVLLAGIPLVAVGWLGWRLLEQDRALDGQRLRERLDNAAALAARELDRSLAAWNDLLTPAVQGEPVTLPANAVLLVFDSGGVHRQQGVRLPYYPQAAPLPGVPTTLFAAAEAQEFREQDLSNAATSYRAFAASKDRISVASVDFVSGKVLGPPVAAIKHGLGSHRQPNWSSDGKYLAYPTNSQNGMSRPPVLSIQSVETGEVREVRPQLDYFQSPRWAPDDKSFVVQGTDTKGRQGVHRIDAATGATEIIAPGAYFPLWAPDGKKIFYGSVEKGGYVERDLISGTERVVLPGVQCYGITTSISSDGRHLAVICPNPATKRPALTVVPLAGGETRELGGAATALDGATPGSWTTWTQDGRSIWFGHGGSAWIIPAAGGQARRIDLGVKEIRDLRVQPGGNKVAFWYNKGDTANAQEGVYVMENFLP